MNDAVKRKELAKAYRQAIYQICTDPPVILRLSAPQPMLQTLHQLHGCRESTFLTACNPRSKRLDKRQNEARMQKLKSQMDSMNQTWLPAVSQDPAGVWPDEESLWLPAMGLAQARILGRDYEQLAFVHCDPDTIAHLVWV